MLDEGSARGAEGTSRSVADGDVHVERAGNGWKVQQEGSSSAASTHRTQAEAQRAGRVIARREAVELLTHGRNGQIRERSSYGKHPRPSRIHDDPPASASSTSPPPRHVLTRRRILRAQAAYYLVSGLWPVAHRRSFEAVTGSKTDYWLVRLVGGLAASIGCSLFIGARGEESRAEITALAGGSAIAFGVTDAVYVAKGRIRDVYLADLAIEVAFLLGLACSERQTARYEGGVDAAGRERAR